jgi:hypothetical protein
MARSWVKERAGWQRVKPGVAVPPPAAVSGQGGGAVPIGLAAAHRRLARVTGEMALRLARGTIRAVLRLRMMKINATPRLRR